jgi:limonene-1,2-epoxide hydrolase
MTSWFEIQILKVARDAIAAYRERTEVMKDKA